MGKKEEKKVLQSIFANALGTRSLLFILGFIFSTSWITTIIYDISKKSFGDQWTYFLFLLLSVIVLLYLFHYSRKLQKDFASDDIIDINQVNERSKKVLIVFLSRLFDKKLYENLSSNIEASSISEWLNPNTGYNPWKMPYLAINGHKSTLEKVYILTSRESSEQYSQFEDLIRASFKRNFEMKEMLVTNINDIDDYNSIFNTIYKECTDTEENQIVIDATSGIKLYSIAGSYFALSSEKKIQYIDTNSLKVYQFNNKVLFDEK